METYLTDKDIQHIYELNRKHGWGFTYQALRTLTTKHEKARQRQDYKTMEAIEWRLEDANFHSLNGLLWQGKYEEARKQLNVEQLKG